MATITMGIDLAAQADKTAVCLLRWEDTGPTVVLLNRGKDAESTPLDDKWLSSRAAGINGDFGGRITKVGIDDPFGWPEPFVDAISAWRMGQPWPRPIEDDREDLRLRRTDLAVIGRSERRPLSVSSDRIAIPAMRCAGLLTQIQIHTGDPTSVRRDGAGLCCEVYPDPALREWTKDSGAALGRDSYKGSENSSKRVALLEALVAQLPIADPAGELDQVIYEDDYLDALVCALVARAAEHRDTYEPTGELEKRCAQTEGWIHLPKVPLGDLSRKP